MRKTIQIVNVAVLAVVVTAVLAAGSILSLMVTSHDEEFKRTGLFGSVFFESTKQADGVLRVGAGIENWVPLAIIAIVLTAFFLLVLQIVRRLKIRRENLIESQG